MTTSVTPTGIVYIVHSPDAGTEYTISFPYLKPEYIMAYHISDGENTPTHLVYGADYTINGAVLITNVALPVGARLAIYRETELTQEILWVDGQAVYTPDIMKADDKSMHILQEFAGQISRAVKVPQDSPEVTPEELLEDIYTARDEAAASASTSETSAQNASDSENLAHAWATNPEDIVVQDGEYSAYHWARKAEQQAEETASETEESIRGEMQGYVEVAESSASSASASAEAAAESAAEAAEAAEEAEQIKEEVQSLTGVVTYLDGHDFGNPADDENWQQTLTDYALAQVPDWSTVPNSCDIVNLWDGHEWIYNTETSLWIDWGSATVRDATSETAGIVKADVSATPGTVALRDANGRAKIADPVDAADIASKAYVDTAFLDYFLGWKIFKGIHPVAKPGMVPVKGTLLANAATLYPKAWAYLQSSEGQALCTTETLWQAASVAKWATLADGTQIGWDGIGGVCKYVIDLNAGTIRVPDLRGMYEEVFGYDTLGVGGVHGDAIRNITGKFGHNSDWGPILATAQTGAATGAFSKGETTPHRTDSINGSSALLNLDSSRVGPVASRNRPAAWGALACVYLGQPAS